MAAHSNKAMSRSLQVHRLVGRAGRLVAALELAAGSTYSAVAIWINRRKFREMMPIVVAILMATEAFFVGLITFVVSPFQVLMAGKGIINVGDGRGLDPLLQWWTMAIHPPMLYLGYVGFVVPFAFAMAFANHPAARRSLDSQHAPLGHRDLAVPDNRNHCWAWAGLIRCWDGAVSGAGIPWRMPR